MEEKEIKPKIVETYAEDMARVIGDDRGGLIKKIIHGEEEHEKEKMNRSPELRKNKIYMFVSFLLILLGFGTLIFFFLQRDVSTEVPVEKQFVPIIFSDQNATFEVKDLNKDQIAQTVLSEINTTKVKDGGVDAIYLTYDKKLVGLRQFITLTKSNFVPGNNITFVDDNFLMGMVNNTKKIDISLSGASGKDFFIILKIRSVADIFNSLRTWENKMFSDLDSFLGVELTSDTNYLLTKNFEDGIFENKNARILYDNDNNTILMYVFADENSVIITNSGNATHEIMLRLAASQIKK